MHTEMKQWERTVINFVHLSKPGVGQNILFFFFSAFLHRRDMDYRIFNVRTFLCVRIHPGGGAHRQRVSTTFGLGKTLTICSCTPDGIRASGHGIH